MSDEPSQSEQTANDRVAAINAALRASWVLWMGMTLAQLAMLVVVIVVGYSDVAVDVDESMRAAAGPLALFGGGLLLIGVPIALWARGEVFKRGWVGEVIRPGAFLFGNVIVWAMLESVGLAGSVAALLAGRALPHGFVAVIAFALTLFTWPGAGPMRPRRL
ncbi:MAG: hypothetical protein GC159_14950 [Phycisphaera sp.]|nr:hypothetical protein [Phycisphaera sp.]